MTNPMFYGLAPPMTKEERERQEKLAALAGSPLTFLSPTPEEIEAAAKSLRIWMHGHDPGNWEGVPYEHKVDYLEGAEAALKAAMAVRRGK